MCCRSLVSGLGGPCCFGWDLAVLLGDHFLLADSNWTVEEVALLSLLLAL